MRKRNFNEVFIVRLSVDNEPGLFSAHPEEHKYPTAPRAFVRFDEINFELTAQGYNCLKWVPTDRGIDCHYWRAGERAVLSFGRYADFELLSDAREG